MSESNSSKTLPIVAALALGITPVMPILLLPPNIFLYLVASGISSLGLSVAANQYLDGGENSESRLAVEATKVLQIIDKVALNGSFGKGIALWIFCWLFLSIGLGLQYFNHNSLLQVSNPDARSFKIQHEITNESNNSIDLGNFKLNKYTSPLNTIIARLVRLFPNEGNQSIPVPPSQDIQSTGSPYNLSRISFKVAHPTITDRYVGKISGEETLLNLAALADATATKGGNELTHKLLIDCASNSESCKQPDTIDVRVSFGDLAESTAIVCPNSLVLSIARSNPHGLLLSGNTLNNADERGMIVLKQVFPVTNPRSSPCTTTKDWIKVSNRYNTPDIFDEVEGFAKGYFWPRKP